MNSKWLILDTNYLCHRAFHAMGSLSYRDVRTEVVYGLMRDVQYLQDLHQTGRVAFCFDYGENKRLAIYPEYKANRRPPSNPTEEGLRNILYSQIERLQYKQLYDAGFRNIHFQEGYEADDVIASVCQGLNGTEAIIVAADEDFYQLLSPTVSIWQPNKKRMVTLPSFVKEYRIRPEDWPTVLAIAGGHDNIKGVPGVGEVGALQYVRGELEGAKLQKVAKNRKLWKKILPLVRLPFEGVDTFELQDDEVTEVTWRRLTSGLGMRSLEGKLV